MFFNVTPTQRSDAVDTKFSLGFDQSIEEQNKEKPSFFEGALGAGVAGVVSGFERSKFGLLDALKNDKDSPDDVSARESSFKTIRELQPNPKTVGKLGEFMFGLTEPISYLGTQFLSDPIASVLSPTTLYTEALKNYTPGQTEINVSKGMDQATARNLAVNEGIGVVAGLVAPVSMSGGLAARAISGGLINTGIGGTLRFENARVLRANGYEDMAKQYEVLDTNAVLTDMVLGAAFGAAFGVRGKATSPKTEAVLPSQVDAALTSNQVHHASVDTSPGIAVDGKSAQAHASALNESVNSLLAGEAANVESIMAGARFIRQPGESNLSAMFRESLSDLGFGELSKNISNLELAAKNKGFLVEESDLLNVTPDLVPVTVGGIKGNESFINIQNKNIPSEYRVVEADTLAPNINGNKISTTLDNNLVGDSPVMDYGAPVLSPSGEIIAGNKRIELINRSYAENAASEYRANLIENSQALGIDLISIENMANPVLVRVLQHNLDVGVASKISNENISSPTAANISESLKDISLPENVTVKDFVSSLVKQLPENERLALTDQNGKVLPEAQSLFEKQILKKAYGDIAGFNELINSKFTNSEKIFTGLADSAPKVIYAKQKIKSGELYPFDISGDLIDAVQRYAYLKDNKISNKKWLENIEDLSYGLSAEGRALVVMFNERARSSKNISEAINNYYDKLQSFGHPDNGSIYEAAMPTKRDAFLSILDDDVAYSLAKNKSKSSADELQFLFKAQFGKDAVKLIDTANVKFVQSVKDLPGKNHPENTGGIYDATTKTSYIVADNTLPSEVRGRVLHEIGVHAGIKDMLGDVLYADVLNKIDAKIAAGDVRFIEARRLAEKNAKSVDQVTHETLAYLIENAPESPIMRKILAQMRQWLYRITDGKFIDLDINDLVSIATSSLRKKARSIDYADRVKSVNDFYNEAGQSDTLYTNDAPLPDDLIVVGESMQTIKDATNFEANNVIEAKKMEDGYIAAIDCFLSSGQ